MLRLPLGGEIFIHPYNILQSPATQYHQCCKLFILVNLFLNSSFLFLLKPIYSYLPLGVILMSSLFFRIYALPSIYTKTFLNVAVASCFYLHFIFVYTFVALHTESVPDSTNIYRTNLKSVQNILYSIKTSFIGQ